MENYETELPHRAYAKTSLLLILRTQHEQYRTRVRKQGRMIKRRKYLKQHIYDNTNIFQLPSNKFSRTSAQDFIWQKNYKLKMAINILRQQNSSVKAKLWNIEKENRKMDKQIEAWNLEKIFTNSKNKPYIDMITVSRVFADQDYEIVSTKIDIARHEKILQDRQDEISRLTNKNKQFQKFSSHLNHVASQTKECFLKAMQKQGAWRQNEGVVDEHYQKIIHKLNRQVSSKSEVLDFLKKNLELKQKINNQYLNELQNLEKEIDEFKQVDEKEIDKIKQKMRRIKLQEQNNIKDFKKDLKNLKKSTMNYECSLQEDMGAYIRTKIQLKHKINAIISTFQTELRNSQLHKQKIESEALKQAFYVE